MNKIEKFKRKGIPTENTLIIARFALPETGSLYPSVMLHYSPSGPKLVLSRS